MSFSYGERDATLTEAQQTVVRAKHPLLWSSGYTALMRGVPELQFTNAGQTPAGVMMYRTHLCATAGCIMPGAIVGSTLQGISVISKLVKDTSLNRVWSQLMALNFVPRQGGGYALLVKDLRAFVKGLTPAQKLPLTLEVTDLEDVVPGALRPELVWMSALTITGESGICKAGDTAELWGEFLMLICNYIQPEHRAAATPFAAASKALLNICKGEELSIDSTGVPDDDETAAYLVATWWRSSAWPVGLHLLVSPGTQRKVVCIARLKYAKKPKEFQGLYVDRVDTALPCFRMLQQGLAGASGSEFWDAVAAIAALTDNESEVPHVQVDRVERTLIELPQAATTRQRNPAGGHVEPAVWLAQVRSHLKQKAKLGPQGGSSSGGGSSDNVSSLLADELKALWWSNDWLYCEELWSNYFHSADCNLVLLAEWFLTSKTPSELYPKDAIEAQALTVSESGLRPFPVVHQVMFGKRQPEKVMPKLTFIAEVRQKQNMARLLAKHAISAMLPASTPVPAILSTLELSGMYDVLVGSKPEAHNLEFQIDAVICAAFNSGEISQIEAGNRYTDFHRLSRLEKAASAVFALLGFHPDGPRSLRTTFATPANAFVLYQFGDGTVANASRATGTFITECITDALQRYFHMRDATSIKEYPVPSDF